MQNQKAFRDRRNEWNQPQRKRREILPTAWANLDCFRIGLPLFLLITEDNMKKIGILMGSDSDLPVVQKAIDTLKEFGVPFEVHVYSAHRTPSEAKTFSADARANGFGAIIAAAGMAAHLAGAVAANTTLPVIGIPCKSAQLDGMDALLATVQMPTGIPVATVAIDGAANAALLAAQILALSDDALAQKLIDKRAADAKAVLAKDAEIAAEFNK
jgi:5-(carboxyamino)imidazole ribonucleotide mutase